MWVLRRTRVADVRLMSSCYLVPLVLLLSLCGVDALAPLGPVLVVLGCVTTGLKRAQGSNTPARALASVLGHAVLCLLPASDAPVAPAACVVASVLALYCACDVWPYPITPLEFAALAAATLVAAA